MKKSGDANVTAAVARVSGVSTNGGFITVRGIGDRYVKTCVNGSRIPTLDPFTNNIKLDLFPASLVDNVLITKTASPELSGDWSGAYLSVETKDYPDQLAVSIETAIGYNAQTTFKEVITSDRSNTDWLGYDKNYRDRSHNDFTQVKSPPSQYEEFVALGLGDYYTSLGVSNTTPWDETYFKLGLVQLGLLAPALIDDATAVNAAKASYNQGAYKAQAFSSINSEAAKKGQSFPNNWNTSSRKAPLNFSQSFCLGNQVQVLGKPLGVIGGFRYGSATQYDPNSTSNRASLVGDQANPGNLIRDTSSSVQQQASRETNGWSALLNVAYKLNLNNSISLLFMPNFNGTNNVRSSLDNRESNNFIWTKTQFYEQRKQLVYQLKTEHFIPASKIKIELNASYTSGKSSAPDFKNLQYLEDPTDSSFQIGGTIGDGIHRYYRYLTDNLFDSRITAEMPLGNKTDLIRKVKIGAAYFSNHKESNQYDYSVFFGPYNETITNDDVNAYLNLDKFGITNGVDINGLPYSTISAYYNERASPANHTFGNNTIQSCFAMLDYSLLPKLRISGGLRAEKAKIYTDVMRFDSLNIPNDDPRRDYSNGGFPAVNPGNLNELSFLPSVNLIYKIREAEATQMNLRLNYSKTVARPSIRELSDVATFDYEFRRSVYGNSTLKMVKIDNYDLRFESYFAKGDNISASVFYKNFKNHIELVNYGDYTWENVNNSHVSGIEFEGRKSITKHFEFRANVTFVKSQTEYVQKKQFISGGVKQYNYGDTIKRAMYGQAPYVVNAILSYTADSIGLTATLSYNIQGPRLVIVSDTKGIPDIYELPRNIFDFKVSKTLGKHFSVSLTVQDILNTAVRRSYNYEEGWTLDYDKFRYGTNFIAGISYKL